MKASSALLLRHIHTLAAGLGGEELPDDELVRRFVTRRDETAFEALLHRHGPLVLGVCRRVLRREQDAEDAFQATFLILARKAGSLRARQSVGSWLHGVAYRVAQRVRTQAERRQAQEIAAGNRPPADTLADVTLREAQAILDEELARLPERYRAPLVLCCLEGKTRDEAARQLGWSLNRLKSRLEQGRERLRRRLAARGLALSVALLAATLTNPATAAVPARLVASTAAAAPHFAASIAPPTGLVSAPVASLVRQGFKRMLLGRLLLGIVLLALSLITAGVGLAALSGPAAPLPEEPAVAAKEDAPPAQQEEPLPAGARARLGSNWFRAGGAAAPLAFSPDGKAIVAGSLAPAVALRDVTTGKVLAQFKGHTRPVVAVAVSPDGSLLAAGGNDFMVRVWRVKTGEEVWVSGKHPEVIGSLVFSPDSKLLASGDRGAVRLWDAEEGQEVRKLPLERGKWASSLSFSPDGKALAAGGDGGVTVWDVGTGRKLPRPETAPDVGYGSVAFSPDGKVIATGSSTEVVEVWDTATGKSRWRKSLKEGKHATGLRVAFSPDGRTLATAGRDGAVWLWDVATGKEARRFDATQGALWGLAFSPDGKVLATGAEGSVRFWDPATGKELRQDTGHRGPVWVLAFSPDGRTLASAGKDRTVRLWDTVTGKERRVLTGHRSSIAALAFSPDGKTLASGTDWWASEVRVWDTATGKEVFAVEGPPSGKFPLGVEGPPQGVHSLTFSPDGKVLAVGAMQTIRFLDPATGKKLRHWEGHELAVKGLGFSPDGKLLASGSRDMTAAVWDAATGAERLRLKGHDSDVAAVVFRPDGRLLATAGWDKGVRFWDPLRGKEVGRTPRGEYGYTRAAFFPDGRWVAAMGRAGTAQVWEVATGEELFRCRQTDPSAVAGSPDGDVQWGGSFALALSPDGNTLATGDTDGTIVLWDLAGAILGKPDGSARPGPQDLEALARQLADEDARKAYRAAGKLLAEPRGAVQVLGARLRPMRDDPERRKEIAHLIDELDSDNFGKRQRASARLAELGSAAEPALRKALEGKPTAELRARIVRLLDKVPGSLLVPVSVAELRALSVLERIGTPEAREALKKLADDPAGGALAEEAGAALRRGR